MNEIKKTIYFSALFNETKINNSGFKLKITPLTDETSLHLKGHFSQAEPRTRKLSSVQYKIVMISQI